MKCSFQKSSSKVSLKKQTIRKLVSAMVDVSVNKKQLKCKFYELVVIMGFVQCMKMVGGMGVRGSLRHR